MHKRSRSIKSWFFLLMISLIPVVVGCKQKKELLGSTGQTDGMLFQLTRGACYGKCPVYALYVMGDGRALFHGKRFIEPEGRYRAVLGEDMLGELRDALQACDWDAIKAPDEFIADLPSYQLVAFRGDSTISIQGQGSLPDQLKVFESLVIRIIEESAWVEAEEGDFLTVERTAIKNEIILQLREGASIEELVERYRRQQFTVIEKLSPNHNYWLITFDHRAIEPVLFLKYLKEEESVIEAEFNKRIELRQ